MVQDTSKKRRRGKTKKNKSNKFISKKRVLLSLLFLVLFIISLGVYLYISKWVIPTNIAKNDPLSILIVGTDESEYRDELWEEGDKATLTDSLMVLTFNPNYYRFDVTSIPRDTSVDYVCESTPDYQDQINEVYYLSGYDMDCLEDTVSNFLNVPIDYYVKLNFDIFAEIVDTVGGIDIVAHAADGVLTQENEDYSQTYTWVDGETYHMSGDEALSYSRARHDSEKDYGRGIRQQQVVAQVLKTVLDSDISLDLISQLYSSVETDIELKLGYEYYKFLTLTNEISESITSNVDLTSDLMPNSAWKYMFEWFGYEFNSVSISDTDIEDFQTYLLDNYSDDEISQYFFEQHQFFNEAYSGHYNVVEEQLEEISNSLRKNLGLEEETAQVPSKVYGDNESSGLIPTEWATGSSDDSYEYSDTETSQETDTTQEVDEEVDTTEEDNVDTTDETDNVEVEVDPEEPVEPEVPIEPTDPEQPVDPEEPVEPEDPTDPEESVDPQDPVIPEENTDLDGDSSTDIGDSTDVIDNSEDNTDLETSIEGDNTSEIENT